MKKLLKEFKDQYLEYLLSFLWRQWTALGVAGYGETNDKWFIDPEALLLFTCSIGRYEARLFDEVFDWLNINGSLLNIQRLRRIMHHEHFTGTRVLSAIAEFMSHHHKLLKWKGLIQNRETSNSAESLFFYKNGNPMEQFGKADQIFLKHGLFRGRIELKGKSQQVRIMHNTGFLFKLRALFGITARCEIIAYLLTHEKAHPSLIARDTYYSQKTVQDTLVEMAKSGLVRIQSEGKKKQYWIKTDKWLSFLMHSSPLQWINWPLFLRAFEQIWEELNQKKFLNLSLMIQSSKLRELMHTIRPRIERAGFADTLSDDKLYLGESYIPVFLSDIRKLLI